MYEHLYQKDRPSLLSDSTCQKDNTLFTDVVECLHGDSSADNILKESVIVQVYKDAEGTNTASGPHSLV